MSRLQYYDYDPRHHPNYAAPRDSLTRRYTYEVRPPHRSHHTSSSKHEQHPKRYIINDGNLVIDDKTFRHSHTYIHNRPNASFSDVGAHENPWENEPHFGSSVPAIDLQKGICGADMRCVALDASDLILNHDEVGRYASSSRSAAALSVGLE